MSGRLRLANDIHLRLDGEGSLLAWSPRASADVRLSLTELTILQGLGAGAAPRAALEAAGIAPRTSAEVEAYLAWFLQNGFVERGTRTPATGARDAVLAAVEGGALAASAVRDAARKIRSRLREQLQLLRAPPPQVPTAAGEPLDVAWGGDPRWRPHAGAGARVTVRPQPRGAPPRVSAPVLVSATAYPLT